MSQWIQGGIKTSSTPGTAVQLTTSHVKCRAISFQALPLNTARSVVGDSTSVAGAAGTNPSGKFVAILGAGSATGTPPEASIACGGDPSVGDIDAFNYWIDVVTSGEGIAWSYIAREGS